MVSKPIAVLFVTIVAVATILAYFGLTFQSVQEENLKICTESQQRINSITVNPNMTESQKNSEIERVINQANDEMRKRQFECLSPFIVPEFKESKPENRP